MKKGIKLLIATLFMMPIGVSAATVDVSLSCPATASANSEVSCVIKATPNGADLKGIGVDRSDEGTGYALLYNEPHATAYNDKEKCPIYPK